ncbi:MAG: hypothetical protein Q8R00_00115 [Candidatus Nanoarchaeia archaeon]|nr:hypothetical protein [Candidatus Nanoarchaeia archaeon]
MFEEISAIKSETQRKMMDRYLIQIGDELIKDYMEEKMWHDKRFDELVLFCLGDIASDLEAGIIAYNLFLGNAA